MSYDISKITDDLLSKVYSISKKESVKEASVANSVTSVSEVPIDPIKSEVAEGLRKVANSIRNISYDITFEDISNYMSRFGHEK